MKKISTRQLMVFYGIYSFSIKFIMLPSLLAETAGKDCWLAALFGTIIELGILFLVLNIIHSNQNEDIYCRLRRRIHWSGAKIAMTIFLAIFLFQLFILSKQTFLLLGANLFDNVNPRTFIIPALLLGIFFCFMPSRAIFRSGEIFFVFIIIGLALSVFPALKNINPSEILPVFDQGACPMFLAVFKNLIFFESALFLLMFAGDIRIEKHFKTKFMILATILGLFFVFFVFMFYSLFGPLSDAKNIAISDLTLYSALTQNGRLEWVLVCIWLLLILLRFGITFYCAFVCLRNISGMQHRAGIISISLAISICIVCAFVLRGVYDTVM